MNGVGASLSPNSLPFDAILSAPFGALGVRMQGVQLAGLEFLEDAMPCNAAAVDSVAAQLDAWFLDPGFCFSLPLALHGTPFRRRVWDALMQIPPGQTLTYGALAQQLATSPRALGQALGDNPIPIIVPCHRVLGANGLGGFMHGAADFPLRVKRWFLEHEGYCAA
jgi:methylated-DNA-[protein]-cysteine S-methyltransferase